MYKTNSRDVCIDCPPSPSLQCQFSLMTALLPVISFMTSVLSCFMTSLLSILSFVHMPCQCHIFLALSSILYSILYSTLYFLYFLYFSIFFYYSSLCLSLFSVSLSHDIVAQCLWWRKIAQVASRDKAVPPWFGRRMARHLQVAFAP